MIHREEKDLRQRLRVRVRALREAAGLTLKMAAERGEMSARLWQNVEAGEANVTIATLVRMANALEVDVPELFGEAAPRAAQAKALKRVAPRSR